MIICCPGSLQVKSFTLATTTFERCSTASLTTSQSTVAPIFTPHLHTYTPILTVV
ncbi:MAG: hypothetical protein KAT66_01115 [Candidatus Lokiarchaeota archaeon]|nr:hypothetical protein [Candidatus Lokiarchaeota archaeon]